MTEIDYEAQRLENLAAKQRILAELNLNANNAIIPSRPKSQKVKRTSDLDAAQAVIKRRRVTRSGRSSADVPQRSSARIASSTTTRPDYKDDAKRTRRSPQPMIQTDRKSKARLSNRSSSARRTPSTTAATAALSIPRTPSQLPLPWTATAPPPTRSPITAQFHFPSHPTFRPNKSPLEILSEG